MPTTARIAGRPNAVAIRRRPESRVPKRKRANEAANAAKPWSPTTRARYLKLVSAFPLASIRDESHLERAQEVMDGLLVQRELDAGAEVYLDALSDLVAAYEDVHHAIAPASDADLLRHLMEAKGVTQADIHRATDIPKSALSETLAGKRAFSRGMIRSLAKFFGMDIGILAGNL